MLPLLLKPKHEYDLVRLGGDFDGGYIVEKNSIQNSKSLITLGLGYEWRFEKEYYSLYKKPIYCYDHTINYSSVKKLSRKFLTSSFFRIFKPKYFMKKNFFRDLKNQIFLYKDYKNLFQNDVKHFVKRVGPGYGPGSQGISLKEILNDTPELPSFIKIDIETSEYRILKDLLENQDKFTGIAIEFHDVDLHLDKILNFVNSLDMTLVHIHPMNQALTVDNIPIQIELSFAKKPKIIGEDSKVPHPLDMPGDPTFKDINLQFK